LLATLAVLSSLLGADPGPAEARTMRVIDLVVAQVDTAVITLSELIAETRLVMLRTGGADQARSEALSEGLLHAVLRSMVTRELLLAEARRLQLRGIAQAELDHAVEDVRGRFETAGDYYRFLERIGLGSSDGVAAERGTPPALIAILRAELEVQRFVTLRIRPSIAVREVEVGRCYEENKELLGGEPLARVRPMIEQTIREARADLALGSLVLQLAKKATLRFAPGFEVEVPSAPERGEGRGTLSLRCTLEGS
jgi:hypothetical protein